MGPREIIIIALIVVLLFGAPKLPELARSIGKSMRILKDETKALTDDDKPDSSGTAPSTDAAPKSDAEQTQQRGEAPVPDSTVELPDNDGRGTR
ncbi:Sec-independent protein translocase subunit TatA [Demequina aestuarii]|uniref:Sec-independent protein translocase subunit TatA n=1 Tax=Demequina aestuarii TaxID=327095 RepID=UPI00078542B8|nr:Sec-independent protein translocase subunit TatA [Demequina aestuarii]